MRIFHSFDEFKAGGGECRRSRPIVTVGSFDGVHMGHQRLIADMRSWADEQRCETLILTFHLHPRTFMTGVPIKRITSVEHKLDLLASLGVDNTLLVHFDEALQATSARDFCANYLVQMFNCRGLLLGHNNSIGRGREGTPERVKEYGKELGFEVRVTDAETIGSLPLSSSAIRTAIESGDFMQAKTMLGRPYSIQGKVIEGRKLGRTIGVPTMNLSLEGMVHPPNGVYGVRVRLDGNEYASVANIGVRPTVEPGRTEPLLEVHALDLSGDWYGRSIDVEFIFRVRDERQFSGVEELRAQLQRDIAEVRKRFQTT
ncbi:MAG: bifunctional riboflavin kinase/FAD synthetase [Planctomycetes bacterium]|nr:bifunctional riboflavin kinase/FAD synthetase [Planctomycetota bacterium]NUQ33655.1 bifunctional riboflavin kinase/FAD synthetase [Planctomycetaceae bacterium]